MWRELIQSAGVRRTDKPLLHPPATAEDIQRAEAALGVKLPAALIAFLLETNGVDTGYGEFIWSAQKIAADNIAFRTNPEFSELYMPFDCLFSLKN